MGQKPSLLSEPRSPTQFSLQAILSAAKKRGLSLPDATNVHATAGRGLSARVEGHDLLIGNRAALEEAGVKIARGLLQAGNATPVYVAIDGQHRATLALADPIKRGST